MRGCKGRIAEPNDVLIVAVSMGLSALVRLTENRSSKKTHRYLKSILKMWEKANTALEDEADQVKMGFSPVQTAEPNMRGQFFKFIVTSLKRYGNKELKRVYSWVEGTVGPFNALLNYAGARLRELAMFGYPFPRPEAFQIRVYKDGTKRVVRKEEAEKHGKDSAVKIYWRYGYDRKGKTPRVFLTHPTLPGMDFVDMIRAHCVDLCRQCLIYDVPMTEAHRYIRLLIHNLRPFLDYLYTDGKEGRRGFNRDADSVLRTMVLDIRACYTKRSVRRTRISKREERDPLQLSKDQLREQVKAQLKKTTDEDEEYALQKLLDYLDTNTIKERDLEKLREQMLALSNREGNRWHRVLLSDHHHPKSLKQVVMAGDTLLDDLAPILVVAELPVGQRSGRVDLTIFVRRIIDKNRVWTPVMVLEVKTKTAFDINLFGLELKRKTSNPVTPVLYAWKRASDDKEWDDIITSGPDPPAVTQLRNYEQEIISEYKAMVPEDPKAPASLWKGVIVLDSNQNMPDTFSAFQYLLDDLRTGLMQQLIQQTTPVSVTPVEGGYSSPKVTLFLSPEEGPAHLLQDLAPPDLLPEEDPFKQREPDDRTLTLYVPVASPTSAGVTAARLARDWHLLHHIKECKGDDTEIVWLDLLGDYKSDELLLKRMRLDQLHEERLIDKNTYISLRNLLRDIRFVDLHLNSEDIAMMGEEGVDGLFAAIEAVLPQDLDKNRIIILDGWTGLKAMLPAHHQSLSRVLEQRLLTTLPSKRTDLIWIDEGTTHTKMNPYYQRSCINPLWYDSPRNTHLDEIIYNLPVKPYGFGWLNPQQEDMRIIVQDTPTQAEPWIRTIHVPQLVGVTDMFKGLARRYGIVPYEVIQQEQFRLTPMHGKGVRLTSISVPMDDVDERVIDDALTLIPSVLRERAVSEGKSPIQNEEGAQRWQSRIAPVQASGGTVFRDRVQVDVTRPPPTPKGSNRFIDTLSQKTSSQITRPWRYEQTPRQFPEDPEGPLTVTYPPQGTTLVPSQIDTMEDREKELRRLLNAAHYLWTKEFVPKRVRTCCKKVEDHCKRQFALLKDQPQVRTSTFFLGALKEVQRIILQDKDRRELWEFLTPYREGLKDLLKSENRESLEDVLGQNQDLFLLYGNNLFLALLAVNDRLERAHIEVLWRSIAEWTFYQIGLSLQDEAVRTVYSFVSIFTKLRTRARRLAEIPLPKAPAVHQQRVGVIYWEENDMVFDALFLLPQEDGTYLSGIIKNLQDTWLPPKYHAVTTDGLALKDFADNALISKSFTTVIMSTFEGNDILHLPALNEADERIWVSFLVKHGRPAGRHHVIPWLILEDLSMVFDLGTEPDFPDSALDVLASMTQIKYEMQQAKLLVSADKDLEVYVVHISTESLSEQREFSRTDDLVQFLRTPVWSATGYRTQRKFITWDHRENIEYGTGFSFLKPLVHRSWFFPDEYHYPPTCKHLLAASTGEDITLKPVQQERNSYRVKMIGMPQTSLLRELEQVELSKSQLCLLAECTELYDPKTSTLHPVKMDMTAIMDEQFWHLQRYPRMREALDSADESEFDWSNDGTWKFSAHLCYHREVSWSIYSPQKRRTWRNKTFSHLFLEDVSVDEALDHFREKVSEVVALNQVNGIEEKLAEFREALLERGWSEEQVREEDRYVELDFEEQDLPQKKVESEGTTQGLEVLKVVDAVVRDDQVIITIEYAAGGEDEFTVIGYVGKLCEVSRNTGGESREMVRGEIQGNLQGLEVASAILSDVFDIVEEVLVKEGVVFYED